MKPVQNPATCVTAPNQTAAFLAFEVQNLAPIPFVVVTNRLLCLCSCDKPLRVMWKPFPAGSTTNSTFLRYAWDDSWCCSHSHPAWLPYSSFASFNIHDPSQVAKIFGEDAANEIEYSNWISKLYQRSVISDFSSPLWWIRPSCAALADLLWGLSAALATVLGGWGEEPGSSRQTSTQVPLTFESILSTVFAVVQH